jgi:hypothetical protein
MKVYSCPAEVPPPTVDYRNYNAADVQAAEDKHQDDLKNWLISKGYKGPNTGKIVYFPVADGHAHYMFADGSKSFLIHLPYGDGYQYRDVDFLPKKEILKRIKGIEELAALFRSAAKSA